MGCEENLIFFKARRRNFGEFLEMDGLESKGSQAEFKNFCNFSVTKNRETLYMNTKLTYTYDVNTFL